MSRREMREYASESERTPVLITLWRSLRMSLYVESWENCSLCVFRADWNCDRSPVLTASNHQTSQIIGHHRLCPRSESDKLLLTLHDSQIRHQSFSQYGISE